MSGIKLADVKDVDIDQNGRFKYVLIKVNLDGHEKIIVRGYAWAGYHADIYEEVERSLDDSRYRCECLGGGRIQHNEKEILVYGYSVGFGRADHSVTVEILKKHYPSKVISFTNDGY